MSGVSSSNSINSCFEKKLQQELFDGIVLFIFTFNSYVFVQQNEKTCNTA